MTVSAAEAAGRLGTVAVASQLLHELVGVCPSALTDGATVALAPLADGPLVPTPDVVGDSGFTIVGSGSY